MAADADEQAPNATCAAAPPSTRWQPTAAAGARVLYSPSLGGVVVSSGVTAGLGRSSDIAVGPIGTEVDDLGLPIPHWSKLTTSMAIPRRCFHGAAVLLGGGGRGRGGGGGGGGGGDRLFLFGGEGNPTRAAKAEMPSGPALMNDGWEVELRTGAARTLIPSRGQLPGPRSHSAVVAIPGLLHEVAEEEAGAGDGACVESSVPSSSHASSGWTVLVLGGKSELDAHLGPSDAVHVLSLSADREAGAVVWRTAATYVRDALLEREARQRSAAAAEAPPDVPTYDHRGLPVAKRGGGMSAAAAAKEAARVRMAREAVVVARTRGFGALQRHSHSACVLGEGVSAFTLVFGGVHAKAPSDDLLRLELDDLSTSHVATSGQTPGKRYGHAACVCGGGGGGGGGGDGGAAATSMLVCGGVDGGAIVDDALVLDVRSWVWSTVRLPYAQPPAALVPRPAPTLLPLGRAADAGDVSAAASLLGRTSHGVAPLATHDGGHVVLVLGGYAGVVSKLGRLGVGGFAANAPVFLHHSTEAACAAAAKQAAAHAKALAADAAQNPTASATPAATLKREPTRRLSADGTPAGSPARPAGRSGGGGGGARERASAERRAKAYKGSNPEVLALREAAAAAGAREAALRQSVASLQREAAELREEVRELAEEREKAEADQQAAHEELTRLATAAERQGNTQCMVPPPPLSLSRGDPASRAPCPLPCTPHPSRGTPISYPSPLPPMHPSPLSLAHP